MILTYFCDSNLSSIIDFGPGILGLTDWHHISSHKVSIYHFIDQPASVKICSKYSNLIIFLILAVCLLLYFYIIRKFTLKLF